MTKGQKKWIDAAGYYNLLQRWRFGGLSDPMFVGESGMVQFAVCGKCGHEDKVKK